MFQFFLIAPSCKITLYNNVIVAPLPFKFQDWLDHSSFLHAEEDIYPLAGRHVALLN